MVNNMMRVVEMKIAETRGLLLRQLHEEVKQQSLEFWIEYNYEIAQGRKKETNETFIWLDEEEVETNCHICNNYMSDVEQEDYINGCNVICNDCDYDSS